MDNRQSGILLHITSLASPYGIGDMGPAAMDFVDFLVESRQRLWQILPLTPTEFICGNSPYSSFSAFAGNPVLISPDKIVEQGLLTPEDLQSKLDFDPSIADYDAASTFRDQLFQKAFMNFQSQLDCHDDYHQFLERSADWIHDYALFCVIKQKTRGVVWNQWPDGLRDRDTDDINSFAKRYHVELDYAKFVQYLFDRQWRELKGYANQKGVGIVGDIPIYVAYDSVDVWSAPENFKLDANLEMPVVSGVPPDYFSENGQRWGTPVFDWDYMQRHQFDWWIRRIAHNLKLYDEVRIDHFRAFVNYWEIPAEHKTAIKGYWEDVPTRAFFQTLHAAFERLPLIAEDLGLIDDTTRIKIEALGFPGMKILMFAFGEDIVEHLYLPHNYTSNCVVYTGTHDNNTVQGWYQNDASALEKQNLERYIEKYPSVFNGKSPESIHWKLIELALMSPARQAITPMQDVLGLGVEARMNVPGTVKRNWIWRLQDGQLNRCVGGRLHELTHRSGRSPD